MTKVYTCEVCQYRRANFCVRFPPNIILKVEKGSLRPVQQRSIIDLKGFCGEFSYYHKTVEVFTCRNCVFNEDKACKRYPPLTYTTLKGLDKYTHYLRPKITDSDGCGEYCPATEAGTD